VNVGFVLLDSGVGERGRVSVGRRLCSCRMRRCVNTATLEIYTPMPLSNLTSTSPSTFPSAGSTVAAQVSPPVCCGSSQSERSFSLVPAIPA